ncbi:2Fe-2S ferredoxin isoform X2 [Parasteatoda tepidariorum]|uniref:2Fe-2S ferredoxin isoform X2 n=1 Tax=Parasteatoda tepidariorum TaxID=114398 RepID=UPI00077FD832|nr:ferredoxin-2, mitochondrial isoform X2 [Parasteatoda tepidariorum]
MKFLIFNPLVKSLCASKYQRRETIRIISFCATKANNLMTNKKSDATTRYLCGASQYKDMPDGSTTSSDAIEDCSEMVTYSVKNLKTGDIVEVKGKIGETLMEATANYIPDVHGACGGSRACTTCHMYVDDELEGVLEEPLDEEQDMLDKAAFLKPNSRLSCQVTITKEFEGKLFCTPIGTVNMAVDGHIPEKH